MSSRRIANPEMVTLGRQSRGLTQARLASRLSYSQGLLSKVEHGVVPASDELVDQLSDALHYPVSFFYRPEHLAGSDSICFHHRKRASMPAGLLATIEAQMYLTQLQVRSLLDELEISAPNSFVTIDPDDHEGGPRDVGRLLRAAWKVPRGPIPDLVRVFEAAGGVVVFSDFGTPKLDGMSCWPKGCPPLFFINSRMPVDRARHTIAHELGHLVMHFLPPDGNPETQADLFAQEFLMPSDEVIHELRHIRFRELATMKARWRVSMASVVMAAKMTGALPEAQVRSLFVQLSRAGYRTSEPVRLSDEVPRLLDKAIEFHQARHGYTVEELAAMTDLWPDEFRSRYLARDGAPALRVLS